MAQWPKYICVCVDRAPGHLRPTPHWFSRWTSQTTPSPVWGGSRPSSAAELNRYPSTVICLQSCRSCMAFHGGLFSDLCSLSCILPISAESSDSTVFPCTSMLTTVKSIIDCQRCANLGQPIRPLYWRRGRLAERQPVTLESFQDRSLMAGLEIFSGQDHCPSRAGSVAVWVAAIAAIADLVWTREWTDYVYRVRELFSNVDESIISQR